MISRALVLFGASFALAACERSATGDPAPVTPQTAAAIDDTAAFASPPPPSAAPSRSSPAKPPLVAEAVVLGEWGKADNRASCAPLAFAATGQARGAPRAADFGGGWGVAFDLPNLRSAYGIAGPGPVAADSAPAEAQRDRLREQWPNFRELTALPQPAFAGYGIEGAVAYPADNPAGRGVNSLAYLRVGGQQCTYNVWSRLGRSHLETLLDALRPVPVE